MKARLPSGILAAWIITSVVVVLSANAAFACGPRHGKGHKMPNFAEVDTNGDSKVTEEEFAAHQAERMQQRGK